MGPDAGMPPAKMRFSTRPVHRDDYEFLWNLRVESMSANIREAFGVWNEEGARRKFDDSYEADLMTILQVDGVDAGMFKMEERASERFLARIEILPAYQSRGVGSAVIMDLLSSKPPKPVTLQVFKTNRARRLYGRLGFEITGETGTHYQMKAEPAGLGPDRHPQL